MSATPWKVAAWEPAPEPEPEPEPEPARLTFRDYVASHSSFTSVLVNPKRKAHNHPFSEGGYYATGYYPSDFAVPASTLPAVSDDALASYLQTNGQAYAEYAASARHAAVERDEQRALDAEGERDAGEWSNDGLAQLKEHDEELRSVPDYFFEPDFDLAVPAMFEKACGTYTVSLQAPHEAMILQEQLSHYLDIVETRLLRRISQRSGAFFSALVELQRLQLQVQDAYNNVREVRSEIRRLEESVVAPGAGVVSLSRQRQNALATRELLELIATVRDTQANIQLLLGNEEYAAAMALIRSTQEILEGELKGVHSFRHLGAQLREYVDLINRLRHGDLEMLVLQGAPRKDVTAAASADAAAPSRYRSVSTERRAFDAEVRLAVDAISGEDLRDMVPQLTMALQKTVTDGIKAVMRTATVAALHVCEAHGSAVNYVDDDEEGEGGGSNAACCFDGSGRGWLAIRGETEDQPVRRLDAVGISAEAAALAKAAGGNVRLGTSGKLAPRCKVLSGDAFLCVLRHVCTSLFGLLQRLQVLAQTIEQKIADDEAAAAEDVDTDAQPEPKHEHEPEAGSAAETTPGRTRIRKQQTPQSAASPGPQTLRARSWTTCMLACAERANYFVVQLVTYRSTAAAHLPRVELARFCGLCRGFAAQSEALSGGEKGPAMSRPGQGLRTASAQQAKTWMEREQATSLEKVQMMLDSESWSSSFVTVELPELLNYFKRCAEPSTAATHLDQVDGLIRAADNGHGNGSGDCGSSWAVLDPGGDEKAVLVAEGAAAATAAAGPTRYRVIQSMLMVLGLLRALLDAADDFGAEIMGKDVTQQMVALLRRVNERTRDLVLGTEAMQTADLKSITAKHLAMAAQTLAMLRLVVTLLKSALDMRLPAAHKPILAELDCVGDDLQAHHRKLRAKLRNVAEGVCKGACERAKAELPSFAASRPARTQEPSQQTQPLSVTAAASPPMTNFVKQTVKLHNILVPLLPDRELSPLFGDVIVAHNRFLAETFIGMLETSKSSRLASCVHADVTLYLKATQKLRPALTGRGPDGALRNANERLEAFLATWPAFKTMGN